MLVVLKNYKRAGLRKNGRHDFRPLIKDLGRFPTVPAVLGMSECTGFHRGWGRPRRRLERELNRLWPGSDYRGYVTQRPGHRNWPGVFIDRSQITPLRWHPYGTEATRECLWGVLEASYAGHHLLIKPLHWSASKGHARLDEEMHVLHELGDGNKQVLALGDCNATTRHPKDTRKDYAAQLEAAGLEDKVLFKCAEDTPGGELSLMTGPLSLLEKPGGWGNAGTLAEDFTPTVNGGTDAGLGLRIDHILTSRGFAGTLVPGSYHVYINDPEPDPDLDDHRMLSCVYEFTRVPPPRRATRRERIRNRIRGLRDPGAPPPTAGASPPGVPGRGGDARDWQH